MGTKEESILPILLKQLRLPTMAALWEEVSLQADLEGWGSKKCLKILCEHELTGRTDRRMIRHLKESCLPLAKTLADFDFKVTSLNKTLICTLASGGSWLKEGRNILIFGPSGVGKTHLAAAIGAKLLENKFRVLFIRTTELIQKLQASKQALTLAATLEKLDKYDCLILDDFGYANKDLMETNVLFELVSERYERRSLIITCNQPFSEWTNIFQDKAMAVAAIDRLVHDAQIIQINCESYRRNSLSAKTKASITTQGQAERLSDSINQELEASRSE
jgi:DNA replication protein DnaC